MSFCHVTRKSMTCTTNFGFFGSGFNITCRVGIENDFTITIAIVIRVSGTAFSSRWKFPSNGVPSNSDVKIRGLDNDGSRRKGNRRLSSVRKGTGHGNMTQEAHEGDVLNTRTF